MDARLQSQRLAVGARSAALLFTLVALASASAWALAGPTGALWTGLAAVLVVALSAGGGAHRMLLRQARALPLTARDAPWLVDAVGTLAHRAGFGAAPRLYYVPSSVPNAFALGDRRDPAIAVTDGLLRALPPRELVGVLAHEVAHIRHGDLVWMQLAGTLTGLTRVMSQLGLALAVIGLPLALVGQPIVPLGGLLALGLAPAAAQLAQLALSRARELRADVEAAALTGDPLGLAAALTRLEQPPGGLLARLFGWRAPRLDVPEALRSHPPTPERVARLRALGAAPAPTARPLRSAPGRGSSGPCFPGSCSA